jgi:hypothetical protein
LRLSSAEIRHVFWQLVLACERSAALLLQWSWWRRSHQWWARWYHYRKRAGAGVESPAAMEQGKEQAQHVPEREELWKRLEPLLPTGKRSGRGYSHDRRVVLEAIVHVMQSDCGWQALPSRFPSWKTVHAQYRQWRRQGIWQKIWA